ncbi:hypothetical protein [Variovorax sp. YR216]|uniref:hypothetical protein n=1 Tax=Variovorax sp. YR216 TaxID=1882828 RepID=UPI000B89884F|nr:hypothetical protein [Variovorax sp. YR216]
MPVKAKRVAVRVPNSVCYGNRAGILRKSRRKRARLEMAKTVRTAGTTSAKSRTTKRKVAGDDPATSAETKKQAKKKAVSSAALLVEDEFNNLRWAHRAYDCVQNFLAPLNSRNVEEFLIEPSELTALMEVINAEVGRRIQTVGEAIHAARKVLH